MRHRQRAERPDPQAPVAQPDADGEHPGDGQLNETPAVFPNRGDETGSWKQSRLLVPSPSQPSRYPPPLMSAPLSTEQGRSRVEQRLAAHRAPEAPAVWGDIAADRGAGLADSGAGASKTGHLLGRTRGAQDVNAEEHGFYGAAGCTIYGAQEATQKPRLERWRYGIS